MNVYSPDSGKLLTEHFVTKETKNIDTNRVILNNAVYAAAAPYRESSVSWQELLLVWEAEQMSRHTSKIHTHRSS